jgi:hypothetical protein
LEKEVALELQVRGPTIVGTVDGSIVLGATDSSATPFENGGVGLVITEGALSTDQIAIEREKWGQREKWDRSDKQITQRPPISDLSLVPFLAEAPCRWTLEKEVALGLQVRGATIAGTLDGSIVLRATDSSATPSRMAASAL